MRKSVLFLFTFLLTAYSGWADGPRYVYEVRDRAAPSGDPWSMNMGVVAEAARLFSPVTFSKSGGEIEMTLDTSLSFSLTRSADIERSPTRVLVRHEVVLQGAQATPKPAKRSTIRFSLSELMKKGGRHADSPLMYALRKAIDGSAYRSGKAWVESANYDDAGRFTVVVALSRK